MHFCIYVVGNGDLETDLAPFQQNNMDDVEEQYLEFVDCTEEVERQWEDFPLTCLANSGAEREYETIAEFAYAWFGYEEQDGKFGFIENPNGKWDWWVIGGRWSDMLPLKSGKMTDQAYIEDIDQSEINIPSAVVYNGKWIAGKVENPFSWTEEEEEVWDNEIKALFSDLPPDTVVTVVDCHT